MKGATLLLLLALVAVACSSASPVDSLFARILKKRTSPPVVGCNKKGVDYRPGDQVPSDDCNRCYCAGPAIMCTLMYCPEEEETCEYNGRIYANGENFPAADGCNNCFCSGNMAACTAMLCPSDQQTKGKRTSEPQKTCTVNGVDYPSGETVPSGDCNHCWCMNGAVGCTLMGCIQFDEQKRTSPPRQTCKYNGNTYQQGDSFPSTDGCNTCSCSGGPNVACTLMLCPENQNKKRTPRPICQYNGQTYQQDETFPAGDGCNTCSCLGPFVSCSLMACGEIQKAKRTSPPKPSCQYNGQTYVEDDTFPSTDGCNSCFCSGPAVGCTLMACPENQQRKRTSPPRPTCQYNGRTYVQGQTFPSIDGCNNCFCSGPAVGCTMRQCPETQKTKRTSPPKPASPFCVYNGQVYVDGESFDAEDGCNRCFCAGQNAVACTYMACPVEPPQSRAVSSKRTSEPHQPCTFNGNTYQSGDSWKPPGDCNSCFCWNGAVGCTEMGCVELEEEE